MLKAINLDKPDQIPVDLGTTNCTTLAKKAYQELKRKLGVEAPDIYYIMRNFQIVKVDEKILKELKIDTRGVLGNSPSDVIKKKIDDQTYINQFGIKYRQASNRLYYDMVEHPLSGKSLEEFEDYKWPDPYKATLPEGFKEKARRLHKEGQYAAVGDMVETGIFEPSWYLRGMSEFLMDLEINKEFAHHLLQSMLDYQMKRMEVFLEEVGGYLDIVFIGDDLAMSDKTLMSPKTYREMVKPYQKKYIHAIKSMTNAKLMYHSDGNIFDLVEDLIEMGVDILNPVEPGALDLDELKRRFGDRLCFWGGIDTKQVLPRGTAKDVKAEVERRIKQLGPGGYVLASVHDIQANTPPENIITMFKAAKMISLS